MTSTRAASGVPEPTFPVDYKDIREVAMLPDESFQGSKRYRNLCRELLSVRAERDAERDAIRKALEEIDTRVAERDALRAAAQRKDGTRPPQADAQTELVQELRTWSVQMQRSADAVRELAESADADDHAGAQQIVDGNSKLAALLTRAADALEPKP